MMISGVGGLKILGLKKGLGLHTGCRSNLNTEHVFALLNLI